jgi:hypothetical protein
MALANLEARGGTDRAGDPLSLQPSHHSPRAKSVIYLFMAGGPSQLDLFDRKPDLNRLHGQPIPESFVKGKRFAFMNTFSKERPKLLASPRRFSQNGQSGAWISELLPNIGSVADKLTLIRSMNTNVFNHAPAKMFANTGSPQTCPVLLFFSLAHAGLGVACLCGEAAFFPVRIRACPSALLETRC